MNEEEVYYEKQMDSFYQAYIEVLKEKMSPEWLKIVIKYSDALYLYKIEGIKIRLRLLKEIYGYVPPTHISFDKALTMLIQPSEHKSFKNKAVVDSGNKSTLELLEAYIKKRGGE